MTEVLTSADLRGASHRRSLDGKMAPAVSERLIPLPTTYFEGPPKLRPVDSHGAAHANPTRHLQLRGYFGYFARGSWDALTPSNSAGNVSGDHIVIRAARSSPARSPSRRMAFLTGHKSTDHLLEH